MTLHKKIFYTVTLLSFALSFTACEDYLKEDNRSDVTAENYFDETNADELVVATYSALREAYNNYDTSFYGTDIATQQGEMYSINALNEYYNITADNGNNPWYDNYRIVSRANTVINRYENQITFTNATVKAYGIAQAKALRALAYYNLVQQYGGVVVYLNEIEEVSYSYTRSSEEETFTQIITDLEDAIPDLKENPSEWGRFSKRAAQHLLADVYTTKGYKTFGSSADFTTAAQLAESAINGYDIRSQTYAQVFDFGNQQNNEVLFAIQYGSNGTDNYSNNKNGLFSNTVTDYVGIALANNPYGTNSFGGMPTNFFYSLFEDNDTREDVTLHRVLYASEDVTYSVQGVGEDVIQEGDTVVYYPKHTLSATELQDRLNRYWVFQPGTYYYDEASNVSGTLYQYSANINHVNFPIFAKFDEEQRDGYGYRDLYVFRVAETHLIASEAYLNAGNPSQALSHLNRVRERATGVANHYTSITIDDILNERAIELSGEENRWAILKRTGKLEERVAMYNPHYQNHGAFNSNYLLRPIPTDERALSDGSLEQNPGY